MKKWIAGAAVAATVAGAGAGSALLNAPIVATAQSTSTQGPRENRKPPGWMAEALKRLVDAGTINQSQADAVSEALMAAKPEGRPHGPGRGPGIRAKLSVAATAIGIEEGTLRSELRSGKTIAQVAQEHNVDVQKVVDALVADLKTHLGEAVAAGRITQAQADERLANAPARITEMVNNRPKSGGPHGHGGRGGPDREAPVPPPPTPPTTTG